MKSNNVTALRFGLAIFSLGAALTVASSAVAQSPSPTPVDYVEMFKTKIMPCLHPTVKSDSVNVEMRKEPATVGDVTTARVEAFYAGLIKKNSLQADIMIRQAGSIRQFQVKVLSDTSILHGVCELTSTWTDF